MVVGTKMVIALRQFAGIADHAMAKQYPLVVAEKDRLQGLWG